MKNIQSEFSLSRSIEILERTPMVLDGLLHNISSSWYSNNEGDDTWSPYDIMGHLIHGELTDWIVRIEQILSEGMNKHFEPFDRYAQFESSRGKSLDALLTEFKTLRLKNLARLQDLNISTSDLGRTGIHPSFGEVTLMQLIATWVVHDLNHVAQISRVMASQYKAAVGPWIDFLKILQTG